jgi:hypothetical protein
MFEAEIEMERKSSSFGPVLFIAILVLCIASVLYYAVSDEARA